MPWNISIIITTQIFPHASPSLRQYADDITGDHCGFQHARSRSSTNYILAFADIYNSAWVRSSVPHIKGKHRLREFESKVLRNLSRLGMRRQEILRKCVSDGFY